LGESIFEMCSKSHPKTDSPKKLAAKKTVSNTSISSVSGFRMGSNDSLERARLAQYRFSTAPRVQTAAQAARFIDRMGFCWLFAPRDHALELPSLFEAVKGKRNVHIEDWDADSDRVWAWKSDLPAAHKAYYGKALAGKPCFISLKLLPAALAALGEEDVERAYRSGALAHDAKRLYDALCQFGAAPTQQLKRNAGFAGKEGNARYHRALDDLQRRLLVMPMGAANEGMAWPSQIFDLTANWYPDAARAAKRMDLRAARVLLVERYIKTVLAAKCDAVARLFAIPRAELQSILDEMASARRLRVQDGWALGKKQI